MSAVSRRLALLAASCVVALAGCGSDTTPTGTGSAPVARPATGALASPALRGLPQRSATVWAVGDGADGGDGGRALATLIARGRPDLFLYLGDVYESGTPAEFASHYDALYGAFKTRTAPTPGNHDYAAHAAGYDPYWRRALGGPVPDYYALSVAGWQILSLNSEAQHDASSAQVGWLRSQVEPAGTCRIAFWHRPRYSAGLHGDQPDVAPLWDALKGHATLVLGGHDHTSQRLRPIGGVVEIVAGAGGHRAYPLNTADRRLAYGSTGVPTALRMRLSPGVADLSFVRRDGTVLDRHRVRCRAH